MNGCVVYNILKCIRNYTYYASVIPYKLLSYVNAGEARPYTVDRLAGRNIVNIDVGLRGRPPL